MFQTLYNNFFKRDEQDVIIQEQINKVVRNITYLSVIETLDNFDKQTFYNKLVTAYPATFTYIDKKYHTINMCDFVTGKIPDLIKYCKYQTIDMCKRVVNKKPQLIKYCTYKTPDMVRKAIDSDYKLIEFIDNQTLDICRKAVSKDPYYFKFTKIQNLDMCKYACSHYPEYIQYCKVFDEELCLLVLEVEPYMIKYINKDIQTKDIIRCVLENPEVDISLIIKYMRTDLLKSFDISVLYDFIYKDTDILDSSSCCICLDDYIYDEKLTNTICCHTYHTKCLQDWLLLHNTCPLCNNIIK